jgi:hypothetical protein
MPSCGIRGLLFFWLAPDVLVPHFSLDLDILTGWLAGSRKWYYWFLSAGVLEPSNPILGALLKAGTEDYLFARKVLSQGST